MLCATGFGDLPIDEGSDFETGEEDRRLDIDVGSNTGPPMSLEEKYNMSGWSLGEDFDPLPNPDDVDEEADPALYRQVRSFLLDSPAYRWLLANAQSSFMLTERTGTMVELVTQEMDQIISSMRNRRSRTFQVFVAEFVIDWDLRSFLESQEYGVSLEKALENAITLTGTMMNAQALSCQEYMDQTWPSSGHRIVQLLQEALGSSNLSSNGKLLMEKTFLVTLKFCIL